jgi:hypothetical protein
MKMIHETHEKHEKKTKEISVISGFIFFIVSGRGRGIMRNYPKIPGLKTNN